MNTSAHVAEWFRMVVLFTLGIIFLGVLTAYVGGGLYAFLALFAFVTLGYVVYQWDQSPE
ncbi:hypothetical protein [Halosolutus halophilus]|uniref:hypothetical protein n=1 Tax=Halosolutus halophilus TaxID=1552990 RepID=UPI00223512E5|nr:hypothetical protein [Halosolutus halophilus]